MHYLKDRAIKVYNAIGKRNAVLFTVALFIALGTIVFNDIWLTQARKDSHKLFNLNTRILDIDSLEINLLKAESAQRGYLLTESKDYLRPYAAAVATVKQSIDNIRDAFTHEETAEGYFEENELLVKLSESVTAKVSEMDLTIQLANEGDLEEAEKIVDMDRGLLEMSNVNVYSNSLRDMLKERTLQAYEARNFKRTIARVSTILSPLILLVLMMLIVRQLINELTTKANVQQQISAELDKHKENFSEQSKLLQSLAFDYQSDVEREKYKLAREIHDELGSILTATKMDISWVMKSLKKTQPEVIEKLKKTNQYIDQGINFKRQIVQDLHPSMIESFGFWSALNTLIQDATERGKWKLNLSLPDETLELNETISLVTYRILQETLNNAIKYAKADALSIYIINDEQNLKIEIQDNGIGVDLDALKNETHGLSGMRNRVLALGGHMDLVSTLGNGLLTLVILPLDIKKST
ncbi:MAG: CHASE3 domain-containing protein [Methylophilaceae bacterium]